MNSLLEKTFFAEAAIPAYSIVKMGAADTGVVPATAAADFLVGVAARDFDAALGERIDILTHGIAPVKLGGAVTRGGPVTSDANADGVAPAPAAGTNVRIIGFAMASGVAGDVIDVLVSPGMFQG